MRGDGVNRHRGAAGGGVILRRGHALLLVLADQLGMKTKHAPVKAKELQPKMEHLQPAKE